MARATVWPVRPRRLHAKAICVLPALALLPLMPDWPSALLQPAAPGQVRPTRRASLSALAAPLLLVSSWRLSPAAADLVPIGEVPDPKMQEALLLVQDGRLSEAEAAFSAIVRSDPSYASAWSNRGQARVDLGRYEEAASDFSRAVELAPQAPVPRINRANALLRLYDTRRDPALLTSARIDCLAAVRIDPTEESGYYNLGEVWKRDAERSDAATFRNVKWRQAADAYREAVVAAPGIAAYPLKEAFALFEAGEDKEARRLLAGLARKYPAYVEAGNALAAVALTAGDASAAQRNVARCAKFFEEAERAALKEPGEYATKLEWTPRLARAFQDVGQRFRGVTPFA